jgi:subtilisin
MAPSFSGVAKDADLIAIQVFSRKDSSDQCNPRPTPCSTAFVTDITQGLERVLELHNDPSFTSEITSVNLSLGGGAFSTPCDSSFPGIKAAVDNLRAVGIVTIAATGNEFLGGAIGGPALYLPS